MALTRDIPFTKYGDSPPLLIKKAIDDLNALSDFRGPRIGGKVTARTLFRGDTPGDLVGPYISQLLFKAAKFGADIIEQRIQTTTAGSDYLTTSWLPSCSCAMQHEQSDATCSSLEASQAQASSYRQA